MLGPAQGIRGVAGGIFGEDRLQGGVPFQGLPEALCVEPVSIRRAQPGQILVKGLAVRDSQVLQIGLEAKMAGQLAGSRVDPSQRPEGKAAKPRGQSLTHSGLEQMRPVAKGISPEALVSPISGKGHGDVLPGHLADVPGGQGAGVGEGLVEVPGDGLQDLGRPGLDREFAMVRAQMLGALPGYGGLVMLFRAEADGIGQNRAPHGPSHGGHHQVGIDPPGKKRPQGHLAHEPVRHRPVQKLLKPLRGLVRIHLSSLGEGERPVGKNARSPLIRKQALSWLQLVHVAEDGQRGGDIAEAEIAVQGPGLQGPIGPASGEQGLDFGSKGQIPAIPGVVQRLLAHPVPGQKHPAALPVPEGNGEHALQMFQAVRAPLLVGAQDDLGVAARAEGLPQALQLPLEVLEIIDFPVKDHSQTAVQGNHGLLPAGKIDDGKSAMPQGGFFVRVHTLLVRAAMGQNPGHLPHPTASGRRVMTLKGDESGDAAHFVNSLFVIGYLRKDTC